MTNSLYLQSAFQRSLGLAVLLSLLFSALQTQAHCSNPPNSSVITQSNVYDNLVAGTLLTMPDGNYFITETGTAGLCETPLVNSPTICEGSSVSLTVTNCAGTITWNDASTGATKTVGPTTTTNYIATCTVGNCITNATATVKVNAKPNPLVNSPTICEGSSANLTVTNCAGIVTWNDASMGATKTVSPSVTTNYIATCTVGNCICTTISTVTVNAKPNPSVNSPTICVGSSVNLIVTNCAGTVTWNDASTGATKTVSPNVTTNYTATCMVGNCICATIATVTVSTKPAPSVNNPTICAGSSTSLNVTNCAGTVTWNDASTGATKTVNPNVTTNYIATCTMGSCVGSVTATVMVSAKPTPSVNSPIICAGSSTSLNVANCAGTVTWNDASTGATKTVSPNVTTNYIATCTLGSCSATTTATVTVSNKPTPSVNNPTICAGSSTSLNVTNCAGTVTWNDASTGATKIVSPNVTTNYIATCTMGSCSATTTATVTVSTKPTPSVNSPTICAGSSASLNVTNCAGTVTWNDASTGATKTVSPNVTTNYIATCTMGSCIGSVTATVTVSAKPTPAVNNPTICAGSSASLNVINCAGTVTWNDASTGATKTVSPNVTTNYIATCMMGSCTGSVTATVTVSTKPTPSVNNPTICAGSSASLNVTNCAGTVTWNDASTGATKTVSPNVTTNYIATCTMGSCIGSITATVTVSAKPTPSVNNPTICTGSSASLTVTNCAGTVTWNDASTGASKTVSPSVTTNYIATCTMGSCTGSVTATVTVSTKPAPSVNNPTICAVSSTSLNVTNCAGTVTWNDASTGATKTVSPNVTTNYVATCTMGSCSATTTATVTVSTKPTPSVNNPTICAGSSTSLNVTNCAGTVTWNDASTGATKTVSPNVTTNYIATCTMGSCSATTTATVTVSTKPTPTVNNPTICAGSSASLNVTNCAGTVTWNDASTGATKNINPSVTTNYIATCTIGSCSATTTATVTVSAKPTPSVNSPTICAGSSASLNVTNCAGTVTWNDASTGATKTVSPNVTTNYIATCTMGSCSATTTATVTVSTKPTPAVNNPTICAGSSASLNVTNCAGTVTWNDASTGATKIVNPNVTTNYIATCTMGSCSATTTATVTVSAKPTPAVNNPTICAGSSASLNVTNCAGTVTWNDASTGATKNVNPNVTTNYIATCTMGSCVGSVTATVTVSAKPAPTVNNPTICAGSSASLNVTNCAGTVTWNDASTGATKTVSPNVTTNYIATCTLGSCIGSVTATVTVSARTNAGNDKNLTCVSNNQQATTTVLTGFSPSGGTWSAWSGNPSVATVSNTGTVSNMALPSTYRFIYTANGCADTIAVISPNCGCPNAAPQVLAPNLSVCIGDNFPSMQAFVTNLGTADWFTQATGGVPVATNTLTYKPTGTVTQSMSYWVAAKSTNANNCNVSNLPRVEIRINVRACNSVTDLALKKSINKKIARIGDLLTYTLKVWNESTTNATGVEVTDSIATTVQLQTGSFVASRGTANVIGNVIKWTIGNVAANGDTVTLTYQIKATHEGVHFNTAEISKTNENDSDSTPKNGEEGEDDIDHQCFTVPIKLCSNEKIEMSVPSNLTNVQWFKNGSTLPIASGNAVLFSEAGTYTFSATNQTCPANGCCPVIIESGANCCPDDLCIPFTIKKRKK